MKIHFDSKMINSSLNKAYQTVLNRLAIKLTFLLIAFSFMLFAQEKPKMNVLFIIADDLNTHLNTYGDARVISPNIDRLASQGTQFNNAFVNYPVCLASRSSFLTGVRPERTKVLGNRGNFRDALPNAVTLPRFFHDNGYESVSCGKVLYPPGQDDIMSWDMKLADFQQSNPDKPNASWGNLLILQPDGSKRLFEFNDVDHLEDPEREKIRALRSHQPAERVHFWGSSELSDDGMPDGQIANAAMSFLESKHDKPFFLAVGFMKPHVHFVAPRKYFDLYSVDSMPNMDYSSNPDFIDLDLLGLQNASKTLKPNGRLNPEMGQRAIRSYFSCISFMDEQVGKVLDKLKELNLDKNTIVVFASDNGFLLGNHGWGKPTLYEDDVRVPLIVSAPGLTKPGSSLNQLVEFVDIYPSLAELCGLPSPTNIDGVSFVPLIKNSELPGKEAVFSTAKNQRMVRTAKYKYIKTLDNDNQEQLFDLVTDPSELKNLVDDPSMKKVLDSHRSILAKQITKESRIIN